MFEPATQAVQKEDSMLKQKAMINANYHALATAREAGARSSRPSCPAT